MKAQHNNNESNGFTVDNDTHDVNIGADQPSTGTTKRPK